jgi:hypothetical protein
LAKKARVYDGTAWQELASAQTDLTAYSTTAQMDAAITAASGLTLISATTIGTAVSSVTVSSCFSATYQNYRITWSGGVSSNAAVNLNFKGSGVTGTPYIATGDWSANTGGVGSLDSLGNSVFICGLASTANSTMHLDIYRPFETANTAIIGRVNSWTTAGAMYQSVASALDSQTNSSTGFTLSPNGGTLTGGVIRVYGYKN